MRLICAGEIWCFISLYLKINRKDEGTIYKIDYSKKMCNQYGLAGKTWRT